MVYKVYDIICRQRAFNLSCVNSQLQLSHILTSTSISGCHITGCMWCIFNKHLFSTRFC